MIYPIGIIHINIIKFSLIISSKAFDNLSKLIFNMDNKVLHKVSVFRFSMFKKKSCMPRVIINHNKKISMAKYKGEQGQNKH